MVRGCEWCLCHVSARRYGWLVLGNNTARIVPQSPGCIGQLKADTAGHAWRFVQFYVPLWFSVIFAAVVYVLVARKLRALDAAGTSCRVCASPSAAVCSFA